MCNEQGCPVAVEVFEGNTADSATVSAQIEKVVKEFNMERVIFVGDRGMVTEAKIRDEFRNHPTVQWITALRSVSIGALVNDGALQLLLFDDRDMAEIRHVDYPGERLIACRNPLMAERNEHFLFTYTWLSKKYR